MTAALVFWLVLAMAGLGIGCTDLRAQEAPNKFALLVGCTNYSAELKIRTLKGPVHDVALLRSILIEHYGFTAENAISLTAADPLDRRPTKAHILAQLKSIAKRSKTDDQVVILLAGHGTQQPQASSVTDAGDVEADSLDEVFLPEDSGRWNAEARAIENGITDDELRGSIDQITDTGARVWLIVDACNSGTMLRGSGDEVQRSVPPNLLIPGPIRDAVQVDPGLVFSASQPARVGLYAAQSNEPAPELKLPIGAANAQPHGLLTYTLCEILTPRRQVAIPVLTYRELGRRLRQKYSSLGRSTPTPLIEGADLDREVLGSRTWPTRKPIVLEKDRQGRWKINAGQLYGITNGSVLRVLRPDATNSAAALGYVEVSDAGISQSTVVPTAFRDAASDQPMPAVAQLPVGAICEVVRFNLQSPQLKVMVAHASTASDRAEARTTEVRATEDKLSAALKSITGDKHLVQVVEDPSQADWQILSEENRYYLVPRCGTILRGTARDASRDLASMHQEEGSQIGPFEMNADRAVNASTLRKQLETIARAQNLLHLVELPAAESIQSDKSPAIALDLIRYLDPAATQSEVLDDPSGIELKSGDEIAFRITNQSDQLKLYVTLLFIDSAYGIQPVYPGENEILEPISPKGSFTTLHVPVNADTTGLERVVAIAVVAKGPPVDFTGLAQPNLAAAGLDLRGHEELGPLTTLLKQTLYWTGQQRGLDSGLPHEHCFKQLTWRTKK